MKYKLDIEIAGLPKILANGSQGWRGRHYEKAKWKKIVLSHLGFKMKPPAPLERVKIVCTRYSSRQSDYVNRADSFKAVIDALKTAGIILDDKDSVVVEQSYPWEQVSPKDGRIRIQVWEIEP